MLNKIRFVSLTLIPTAIIWFACGGDPQLANEVENSIAVQVVQAKLKTLPEAQSYSGTVESAENARLATKIIGWIEKIMVAEGEPVKRGQLLVKLRSKDLEARLAQAEAALAEARAHYDNARINLKRIESLYHKQAATRKELDDMRTAFASAKARIEAARQMKAEVQELLQYSRLVAPFDGVVTRKWLEEGDLVNPGQPVLEVESADRFKIVIHVPETDILKFTTGMPVRVQIDAAGIGTNGKFYQARVTRILPSANPLSRQFEVHVQMANTDLPVKSGMFARVVVTLENQTTLLVPEQAIFKRGQLEGLFVVDENQRARLRWVQTGKHRQGDIEILSGLNPGEMVVIASEGKLLDGQKVEVKP